jgi:uncharacterized cupredoxin-like copper-binding protein
MTKNLPAGTVAAAFVALTLSVPTSAAFAGAGHSGGHGPASASSFGEPGDAAAVSRTLEVEMLDNYYEPESITVEAGETIRFVIRNEGGFVHEFNIGTPEMHAAHQDEMMMMVQHGVLLPDRIDHAAAEAMQASMGHGKHDDPNSALLEPGASAEIVWRFPRGGVIEFACNVPGHYDAGMAGEFEIVETLAQN